MCNFQIQNVLVMEEHEELASNLSTEINLRQQFCYFLLVFLLFSTLYL